MLELGVPFSDPLADGPTIQRAATAALQNGFQKVQIFEILRRLEGDKPVLVMGYFNTLLATDAGQFLSLCEENSVSGLIVPDLPIDEEAELWETYRRRVPFIPFVSPTTANERLGRIDKMNAPFVYAVSVAGVTGTRDSLGVEVTDYLRRVRSVMSTPVLVGFGVSTSRIAADVAQFADGVIVGSAVIERIERSASLDEALDSVSTLVRDLREALDEVSTLKAVSC